MLIFGVQIIKCRTFRYKLLEQIIEYEFLKAKK